MAPEEIVTRRRVIRSEDETAEETGIGTAMAIALAVLAILALLALARGAFNSAPADNNNVTPGTRIEIEGGSTVN